MLAEIQHIKGQIDTPYGEILARTGDVEAAEQVLKEMRIQAKLNRLKAEGQ